MPTPTSAARIFIISEVGIYRAALGFLLEAQPDFCIVGTAADCLQALQKAPSTGAEILLLDLATPLPVESGSLSALTRVCSPARVILLVPSLDGNQLLTALLDGVRGVVVKHASPDVLFGSIRTVAAGQYWIEHGAVTDLVQRIAEIARSVGEAPERQTFGLSTRELDIVVAIAAGCANREIAKRFGISEKTVKHHLTHVFEKLGLSNRLQVALFAVQHGLIAPDSASRRAVLSARLGRSAKTART